jgi:hypothetical protein
MNTGDTDSSYNTEDNKYSNIESIESIESIEQRIVNSSKISNTIKSISDIVNFSFKRASNKINSIKNISSQR